MEAKTSLGWPPGFEPGLTRSQHVVLTITLWPHQRSLVEVVGFEPTIGTV